MVGFSYDKVIYNVLLDVYGKFYWFKEVMKVLNEMEFSGFILSIVIYNLLIFVYVCDGMLDEVMEFKN